jgi:PPK2 family polyphosphate:nucleotide phosphotransferase
MSHDALLVEPGTTVSLKDYDTGFTGKFKGKDEAAEKLTKDLLKREELQNILYAQNQYAVLLVIQAMDAAGKDSLIKHVMSGVNPQGVSVVSFKAPSASELDHDFLWRHAVALPQRGMIGIFNRSYYEEVLVVRVHPELLEREKLPPELIGKKLWSQRLDDIHSFERHLWRNGTVVRKFYLNVSRQEQKKRFLERLEDPDKNWKFSDADLAERERWDDYMEVYEEAIRATATRRAPWYVVPADHKWFTRLIVAAAVADALEEMDVRYPRVDAAQRRRLARARRTLETQG